MSRRRDVRIAIAMAVVSASIQAAQADDAAATDADAAARRSRSPRSANRIGYLADRSRTGDQDRHAAPQRASVPCPS